MRLEDLAISAAIVLAMIVVVLTLTAHRESLARALRPLTG